MNIAVVASSQPPGGPAGDEWTVPPVHDIVIQGEGASTEVSV